MAKFKKGAKVEWKWGPGFVKGTVVESFVHTVHKTIKGSKITRHGTATNPAYHLRSSQGVSVLKLESELHDGRDRPTSRRPRADSF